VCVIFSPKYDRLFETELKLVFYDVRLSSRFVVRRAAEGYKESLTRSKTIDFSRVSTNKMIKNHLKLRKADGM
jgi:hypothetical protein